MDKVSTLIITYKHFDYIETCIKSIIQQKVNFQHEILVGIEYDDIKTKNICLNLQKKYNKKFDIIINNKNNVIKVNKKRIGRGNFLNLLSVCTGNYIARCDGDDFWCDKYKLQKQYDFLKYNKKFVLVYSNSKIKNEINQKNSYYGKNNINKKEYEFNLSDSIKNKQGFTSSMFYRNIISIKEIKFFLKNNPVGDWPLECLLMTKGDGYFMADYMINYRIHKNNSTLSRLKKGNNASVSKYISRYLFTNQIIKSNYYHNLNQENKKKIFHLNIVCYNKIVFYDKFLNVNNLFCHIVRILKYKLLV